MVARSLLLVLALSAPGHLTAQTAAAGTDTLVVVADSGDVRGQARAAQARFERLRQRHFPIRLSSPLGACDEVVGRLCVGHGEGEWFPTPEPEGARELREALLATLDSLHMLIPGDEWVLGQRVWYSGEGGDWERALAIARDCGPVRTWWCAALEGLALHGLGQIAAATARYEIALAEMDPDTARAWLIPDRSVDGDARRLLRGLEEEGADSLGLVLERLWRLADPLHLVPGNDRKSAHYARWTVATLKDGARNPYRLRWGRDLSELTVRHGWEVGWERSFGSMPGGRATVTGHHENESRDYMPPGSAVENPAGATAEQLTAARRRPRSLHQPRYAPVLLPMAGQVALFPRVNGAVIVATHFLPPDTTPHADHDHERPWMEPGSQAGQDDRIGLFAIPAGSGPVLGERSMGSVEGALMLRVPAGAYVVSAESWSPEARRAGRLRVGVEARRAPEDIATLSDVLLMRGGGAPPESLAEALPRALPAAEVGRHADLAIAWEVTGLGFRQEVLDFEVSVHRIDRGVFRRIGSLFGLGDRPPTLGLSWEEAGPTEPHTIFDTSISICRTSSRDVTR